MTNRAALQSPPRISHSLQTREISRSLYCRRPRIAGGTGHHVLADEKSMFRFNGSQKARLCDAAFFPVHDFEQRHAAHCNHRPCRRLGDGGADVRHEEGVPRQRESPGSVQPHDEVGVDRGTCGGVVFANRVAAVVRHEEVVARQRESEGAVRCPILQSQDP